MFILLSSIIAVSSAFNPQYNVATRTILPSSRNNAPSFVPRTLTSTSLNSSSGSNSNDRMPLQKGSTVALITPMNKDFTIDTEALRGLLRHHVASQTDGLCILGTTAEAATLSMEEREVVLRIAVEEAKGKIPMMVGTGTIDPKAVKAQTLQAIDMGCDAALVVTPYYVKPPQRCLVKHFNDVADLGLPVVLYNVPGRTGVDLLPETVGICADHPNIVGIKEATGDITRVEQIRAVNGGDKLLLYSGDDGSTKDFVLRGGDGCISVTANIAPAQMHKMIMAALDGDEKVASELNAPLEMLHDKLFCEANPMPTKWALNQLGQISTSTARPPLGALDEQCYGIVEEALRSAKLM